MTEIPCLCEMDDDGTLYPERDCEVHWNQVINGERPPPELYP